MPSRLRLLSTLIAAVLAVGCTGTAAPSQPPSSAEPITASTTQEGLRITLTLEGQPRSDAASWASVRIENIGDRGIRWAGGGCGDPGGIFIDLGKVYPAGRSDWPEPLGRFKRLALGPGNSNGLLTLGYTDEARWGTDMLCTADLRIETLAAHKSLSMRAGWDGRYEDAPVPTGPAIVEAAFPVIGEEGVVPETAYDSHPVLVSIRTAIVGEGGASVLAPAIAIDAALGDAQFGAWLREGPVSRWVNPDVARIGATWQIGLFKSDANGVTEAYQGVIVDATGKVVGHHVEP
jgi:hypothetical protein